MLSTIYGSTVTWTDEILLDSFPKFEWHRSHTGVSRKDLKLIRLTTFFGMINSTTSTYCSIAFIWKAMVSSTKVRTTLYSIRKRTTWKHSVLDRYLQFQCWQWSHFMSFMKRFSADSHPQTIHRSKSKLSCTISKAL